MADHPGVQLWIVRIDLEGDRVRQLAELLSADEAARARAIQFEADRRQFVVCRGTLRVVLGCSLGLSPADVRFIYGPEGRPALVPSETTDGLDFNASHSKGLAVIALSRVGRVGVDVEHVRPLAEALGIARMFFSPREVASLTAAPQAEMISRFYRIWTGKEACLKVSGIGLSQDLSKVDILSARRGSLIWLAPAPEYVCAVCLDSHDRRFPRLTVLEFDNRAFADARHPRTDAALQPQALMPKASVERSLLM